MSHSGMGKWAACACFGVLFASASTSWADSAIGEVGEMPALPAAGPRGPHADTSCRLDAHEGIADADSRTAALLICSEIARLNPPADAHYHVTLGKLGEIIILSVTREGDTPEVTADVRELRLHGIEEASIAAPRLAESIVRGTPIVETEKFDNLVGQETRVPAKRGGSVHFSLGVVGEMPPLDQGIGPAPGLDLHVHYETKSWELGGGMRFGSGQVSSTAPAVGFYMAELGGRYFLNDTDLTPFLGGGLGWEYLNLKIPSAGDFEGNNSGLGAYAEIGVEFLRTYHTHLSISARLDLPFFSINGDWNNSCANAAGISNANLCSGTTTYYYAPTSIELRLTF